VKPRVAYIVAVPTVMSVYGLLLIASRLLMSDMARLHTYIRPL